MTVLYDCRSFGMDATTESASPAGSGSTTNDYGHVEGKIANPAK